MLWNNVKVLLVRTLCVASCVSAAANVAQHVSDMENMAAKFEAVKQTLDNYQGGILGALSVGKSLNDGLTATRTARRNLANGEKMTPEEGTRYYESYAAMSPILLDAINSAKGKAPLLKQAGLGPRARKIVNDHHTEKKLFEEQAKSRVPEETLRQTQPSLDRISVAFDEADSAFQS